MLKRVLDEEIVKQSRLVLCPGCDTEFRVDLDAEEEFCEACDECFCIQPKGIMGEEFVWHPKRKF